MMIDTHCHLGITDFDNIDFIIENMKDNIMIASGSNDETNKEVIELINKYPNIYGTIGIHPSEIKTIKETSLKEIEKHLTNPKIIGIGEIGLDYYWDKDNKEEQKKIFIEQIKLARKYNKPIVVHSRDSLEDTYTILEEHLKDNKAVLHCYSGSLEMAKKFSKLNIMFGIGGVLTFKNAIKQKEVVKELPIEYLLLETDSPYLAPEPLRGTKNEPKNILLVANKIAEIKEVELEEVLTKTTKNAIRQFDLPIKL